jgi:hypothetical protein
MVQGPNLPEPIKAPIVKAPASVNPGRAKAPVPAAPAKAVPQGPDSVQISPQAAQVSQLRAQIQAVPEVRPDRVQEVSAKLSSIVGDSASLNAKLAEKLLTEN